MRRQTLGIILSEVSEANPDHAIIYDFLRDKVITYGEFMDKVRGISRGLLERGIKKGDSIGILSYNNEEWMEMFFAICSIGAVAVLLNAEQSKEELLYVIKFADVKLLFVTDILYEKIADDEIEKLQGIYQMPSNDWELDALQELIALGEKVPNQILEETMEEVDEHDVAVIQFTSGTTGMPKAVQITHKSICFNAMITSNDMQYSKKDIILLGAPLYHVLGYIASAMAAVVAGAGICLIKKFKTMIALKAIQELKCTSFHGVPVMYQYLVSECEKFDLSSLKKGIVAGAVCSETLVDQIFKKLELCQLLNYYGQTESMIIGSKNLFIESYKNFTGFRIKPWVLFEIIDFKGNKITNKNQVGNLIIKTPSLMKGYYKNEELTQAAIQDNWYKTGDLAQYNEDGTIQIKGRGDDIINRGGENVSAFEIKKKLMEFSGVKDVAVFGVPDEVYGEVVAACIQFVEENVSSEREIMQYMEERFPRTEVPKYLKIVEELPYNAVGKLQKDKLLELMNI